MKTKILVLHGLGETPQVWEPVAKLMPDYELVVPELGQLLGGWSNFRLDAAVDKLTELIDAHSLRPAHVCGLSLGGILALNLAIRSPESVASLFLSGAQAKPPQKIMAIQKMAMRVLPTKFVAPEMTKTELLAILDELSQIDYTDQLASITVPTTVVCGTKDKANLSGSRQIAAGIPGARLEIIEGAKHQWQIQLPNEFAAALTKHNEQLVEG